MVRIPFSRGRSLWAMIASVVAMVATAQCVAPSRSVGNSVGPRPAALPDVPAIPPDSEPVWLYADSNLTTEQGSGPFTRGVVNVRFQLSASRRERQAAIAAVHGVVVGGRRFHGGDGDGIYIIRLASTTTNADLFAAMDTFKRMPQVRYAIANWILGGTSR